MQDTVTMAEIDRAAHDETAFHGLAVESDHHAFYKVVGFTEAGVIIRSVRSGMTARVVQTGQKLNSLGQVRARIEFARDLGDVEGTLAFDGEQIGALARVEIFEMARA